MRSLPRKYAHSGHSLKYMHVYILCNFFSLHGIWKSLADLLDFFQILELEREAAFSSVPTQAVALLCEWAGLMSGQQCQQVSHSAASGLPGALLGSSGEEFTSGFAPHPLLSPPALAAISSFLRVKGGGAEWEQRMRLDNDAISNFFSMTRLKFPFSHCCVYVYSYLCILVRLNICLWLLVVDSCLHPARAAKPSHPRQWLCAFFN